MLGILVLNAFRRSGVDKVRWALVICINYSILDEIHQALVPGRGPQIRDVFLDIAGAIVGMGIYLGYVKYLEKIEDCRKQIRK